MPNLSPLMCGFDQFTEKIFFRNDISTQRPAHVIVDVVVLSVVLVGKKEYFVPRLTKVN